MIVRSLTKALDLAGTRTFSEAAGPAQRSTRFPWCTAAKPVGCTTSRAAHGQRQPSRAEGRAAHE